MKRNTIDYYHDHKPMDPDKDPLKWVLILSGKVTNYTIFQLGIFITLMVQGVISFIQVVYFMIYWDLQDFIKYGPIFFGSLYGLVSVYFGLTYQPFINIMLNKFRSFSDYDLAGPELKEQIHKTFKNWQLLMTVTVVLGMFAGIFFFPVFGFEYEMYFAIFLFRTYCGMLYPLFTLGYFLTFAIMGYMMISQAYIMTYFALHGVSQGLLLIELVRQITSDYDHIDDGDLYYDEKFQHLVKLRLRFIYRYAVLLKEMFLQSNSLLYVPIIVYTVVGTVFGISVMFFVYTSMTLECYPRIVLTVITGINITYMFARCGQTIADLSEAYYDALVGCSWYYWNKENRKSLMLLIVNCLQPWQLGSGEAVKLDYTLLMKIGKLIYSAAALIQMASEVYKR